MQAAYLADLTARYDEYFRSYAHPLLTVQAGDIDFVGNPEHEELILARVHEALTAGQAAD